MGLVQFVQETKQVQFHHLGQAVASLGKLLGSLKLVFLKHKNYEEAVRDFNASLGEAAPLSFKLPQEDCCQGILPIHGKTCWKNLVIITLVIVVFGPWMRVSKTG